MLARDQPHEVAIVVVELAPRAQPANEVAVHFVGARGELQDRCLLHRLRPGPAGKLHVGRRLGEHQLGVAAERPGLVKIGRIDLQRRAAVAGGDAGRCFEPRGARIRIPAVERRERHILAVVLEHRCGIAKDFARRGCTVADASEVAQCREAPPADHAPGGLADDAEHAADPAGLVAHRIVRNVEVGFLGVAVALQREQHGPWPRTPRHRSRRRRTAARARPRSRSRLPAPACRARSDASSRTPADRHRCRWRPARDPRTRRSAPSKATGC